MLVDSLWSVQDVVLRFLCVRPDYMINGNVSSAVGGVVEDPSVLRKAIASRLEAGTENALSPYARAFRCYFVVVILIFD